MINKIDLCLPVVHTSSSCQICENHYIVCVLILHSVQICTSVLLRIFSPLRFSFFLPTLPRYNHLTNAKYLMAHYRKNILKQLIKAIDRLLTVGQLWQPTVANCFCRGGFSLPSEDRDSLEEEMDLQEQEEESLDFLNREEGCSLEEYVNCDSSLLCASMLMSEDSVSSITQNLVDEAEDDANNFGETLANVCYQLAYSFFLNIKEFRTTSSSNAD